MKHLLSIGGVVVFGCFASNAAEEVSFQRMAFSGQAAPGLSNNITFSSFSYLSFADDGRIAFTANISGPGVASTNNLGLWAGLPGNYRLIARIGEPFPGDTNGATLTFLAAPIIDNHHHVAALGFIANWYVGAALLWNEFEFGRPNRFDSRFFPTTTGGNSVLGHVINAVAMRVELSGPDIGSTNDLAIMAGPPTNVTFVAQKGSPAPGVAGNFQFFPIPSMTLALTPDGNIAFRGTATDPPTTRDGVWFGKAGTLQMVAGKGAAPDSLLGPGYTFGAPSSENVEVNAQGKLAFATYLSGPGLNNTNSEFVVAGTPANLRVIAQNGQPAPGIPGAFFQRFTGGSSAFSHVLLGADGTVAFVGCYSQSGTDFGLWLAPTNGATPMLLMRSGQQAPGAPAGAVFTNSFSFLPPFEQAFMNSRNQIVFRALAGGPGIASSSGIWLADPNGVLNLVLRAGSSMDIGGGVIKQVSNVSFGVDPEIIAGPEDGRRSPFNDRGESALLVRFTDFTSGLFIARTGIILSGQRAGNDIRIWLPTLTNKTYRVDYTTNLSASSWSVLRNSMSGTGGQLLVTDTNAVSLNARFYRAVRLD